MSPSRFPLPSVPPAGEWRWKQHGPAAGVLLLALLGVILLPAEYASAAGVPTFDPVNAQYMRVGIAVVAAALAVFVRGQPWWHTLACTLLALGHSGQIARYIYSEDGGTMPLALLLLNLGILTYLGVIGMRPSVYERLEECAEELETRDTIIAEQHALIQTLMQENIQLKTKEAPA